ncbi:hypothetical protein Cgig2_003535 [Carnegiea gigantea]|uniref:Endonuclease/exonuclease/phosphatase domain-containing protein n=1 Tax=Carnegiea gigantea TaxID=171969 RepID=A0A9Q1Q7C9_9CARY|nr:hypothetical protein Cgig2_003535 [Carnegiea gigantea]
MRSLRKLTHLRHRGFPPMANLSSWNIRSLNWANKQEEVKLFLHSHNIGWKWAHNFTLNPKGRLWLAWNPKEYKVVVLQITEQFIHTRATQLYSQKDIYATFVYGFNHAQQRAPMWADLETISHQMQEAWCVLGDFNTILRKEDRLGGGEVADYELQELQNCLDSRELTEMPYSGAYYTWSNKTVWSRIDRALINGYWHDPFDYTHAEFPANELSDHSTIIIQFLQTSKPRHSFQYCDMWSHHPTNQGLISQALAQVKGSNYFQQMQIFLATL